LKSGQDKMNGASKQWLILKNRNGENICSEFVEEFALVRKFHFNPY
jgi:hypothetical protein